MKFYGVFDVLGPVMIGPSSSHTAGAARLGKIAGKIAGCGFKRVDFLLHGSFAETYKGHGTDRALVAGVLGMEPYDERLRSSLEIAKNLNIEINFIPTDLGDEHPNTVKIIFYKEDNKKITVMGSSIGGGNILITEVDGEKVEFTGEYPTIIAKYMDRKGMIAEISGKILDEGINIANMKVTRNQNRIVTAIIELDVQVTEETLEEIKQIKDMITVASINPI
ncbi:L-serine dehydratase, beta chain [Caloramator mitchellensis]|uniref:L-serine deaminase n=1 Tax=Caloramator mitchellensis TaxID=908809 RepID=A0A0R3JWS8_CALMK|nr:L-serine ammonia-lyase, iron-sulfur-dependent subunit beta [Caloramator mitchellensis]KRQ87985.1 L-serine dehydratase, beta chain [Caloramator mitchellensis]